MYMYSDTTWNALFIWFKGVIICRQQCYVDYSVKLMKLCIYDIKIGKYISNWQLSVLCTYEIFVRYRCFYHNVYASYVD